MTHNVWGGMRERKFGRVVTISSINGQKGQFAQANYAATKAGDIGFTKALAQEGARAGITVNVVCPRLHQYRNDEHDPREGDERGHPAANPRGPFGRSGSEIAR